MKAKNILIVVVVIFGCAIVWNILGGVTLAMAQEDISGKKGEVWNTTQRAIDLLGRLENEVEVFMDDRQEIIAQITNARNDILAAREANDLQALDQVYQDMMNIQVQIEAYPETNLSDQQSALMYETAGSINRITYARSELIETQVSYNKNRILFLPVGLIFPREAVIGESFDPTTSLPPSTFGNDE